MISGESNSLDAAVHDSIDEIEEFDELAINDGISEDLEQLLTFMLGDELYGIDVNDIKEVIEYENVFKIPLTPDFIAGVINLRGEVVPVIDLNARFYGKISGITKFTCIVITEAGIEGDRFLIGAMIDSIKSVTDIPKDKIEPTPGFGAKIRNDFIKGIGKGAEKFIIILNPLTVFDIEELSNIGVQQ